MFAKVVMQTSVNKTVSWWVIHFNLRLTVNLVAPTNLTATSD